MPKLKLSYSDCVAQSDVKDVDYLQEFQYGNNVFQTTTDMDGRKLISSVIRQLKNTVGVSDGHIYEKCLAMVT